MKFLFPFLLCLLVSAMASAQDLDRYAAATFTHESYSLNYRILYPSKIDSGRKYPVLVYLHGAYERGRDNTLPLTAGGAFFLQPDMQETYPSIVIFPQCPTDDVWAWFDTDLDSTTGLAKKWYFPFRKDPTRVSGALMALLDSLLTVPYADPDRVYIGGYSQGGMGVFDLVARYPDFFAAGFPISGAGNVTTTRSFAGKVPLWIFHGRLDQVVPPRFSRDYYRRLKKAEAEVRYTEYPELGHNLWQRVFSEKELWAWIYAQSKLSGR